MSVDFSQFFNGPIRDSLIAQVSGYLDIPRPTATTAYDKAVALVIGAMARKAGKTEGAQELITHIQDSQTQGNLTSSALSPTVLTNDQFAQIVTVGESEQATILGSQLEPVAEHLEVATGLDRTAVGSLLSIVVPFVLSYLKNHITHETAPAESLPRLLAGQAPHVAPQLDAPALAALGADSLQDLFGPEALAAADAASGTGAQNGKPVSSQPAVANERNRNGWFKWVLILAVILAAVAWVKSCTQSDSGQNDNAKPADQEQASTESSAADTATSPTEVPPPAESTSPESAPAANQDKAAEPASDFPAPASTPADAAPDASNDDANDASPPSGTDVPASEGEASDAASPDTATQTQATDDSDSTAAAGAAGATAATETSQGAVGDEVSPDASSSGTQPSASSESLPSTEPSSSTEQSTSGEQSPSSEQQSTSDTEVTPSSAKVPAAEGTDGAQSDASAGSPATAMDGPTFGEASDTMDSASPPTDETNGGTPSADAGNTEHNGTPASPAAAETDTSKSDSAAEDAGASDASGSTAQPAADASAEQSSTPAAPGVAGEAAAVSTDTPAKDAPEESAASTSGAADTDSSAASEAGQAVETTEQTGSDTTSTAPNPPTENATPAEAPSSSQNTSSNKDAANGASSSLEPGGKTTTFAESADSADKPSAVTDSSTQDAATDKADTDKADTEASGTDTADANAETDSASSSEPSAGKTTTFGESETAAPPATAEVAADSTSPSPAEPAGTTEPGSAAPEPAAATDSSLTEPVVNATPEGQIRLERDGDALRISGTVPDESVHNRIIGAAKLADGHSRIEDELKVDSQAGVSLFDDYAGLLGTLRGYHDVDVTLDSDTVTLGGHVASSQEQETLTQRVQNLMGPDIKVINQTEVKADSASGSSAVSSVAVPQVNFPSGSADIDESFHDQLNQYAQHLKDTGNQVRLLGFADETGKVPSNESLSKRRAESVKAYLVLRGVEADRIQTEGQGAQDPVADNTTEAGRAKNRRVEFHEQ